MPRMKIPSVTLGEAIEGFFRHYKTRDPSESIMRQKRRHFKMLVKHCPRGENTLTRNLQTGYFVDALLDAHQGGTAGERDYKLRQGKRPRQGNYGVSLDSFRTTYKQFSDWLKAEKLVYPDFNPVYQISTTIRKTGTRPAERQFMGRHIPFEEWGQVLDTCHHPRDRFLFACGLHLGRRASELAFMKWGHINREKRQAVLWNIKRNKPVQGGEPVHLSETFCEEYDRYLAWWLPRYGEPTPEGPLLPARMRGRDLQEWKRATEGRTVAFGSKVTMTDWPLNTPQPVRELSVRDTVHSILRKCGWSKQDLFGEGGHTLRRSCAAWVEEYGSLEAAQVLLDHESNSMTQRYTKNAAGRRALDQLFRGSGGSAGAKTDPEPPQPPPAPRVPEEDLPVWEPPQPTVTFVSDAGLYPLDDVSITLPGDLV